MHTHIHTHTCIQTASSLVLFVRKWQSKDGFWRYDILFAYFVVEAKNKWCIFQQSIWLHLICRPIKPIQNHCQKAYNPFYMFVCWISFDPKNIKIPIVWLYKSLIALCPSQKHSASTHIQKTKSSNGIQRLSWHKIWIWMKCFPLNYKCPRVMNFKNMFPL